MLHPSRQLVFILLLSIGLVGCGSDDSSNSQADSGDPAGQNSGADRPDPTSIPLPEYETGKLKIYSTDTDAWVLVDGQPILNERGVSVTPPCEVTVERGTRTITLTKPGFQDRSREVVVSEMAEIDITALAEATESSIQTATAPLFSLSPGEPVLLESLSSPGDEFDPFLSADGLSIWFAADRSEGKGIYTAFRTSIWHHFESPELLLLTRGSNVPASPSVTADSFTLYYSQPTEACIWTLSRPDLLSRFSEKERAFFDLEASSEWSSAQVLGDHLRFYWTQKTGDDLAGYAAVRKDVSDDFSKPIPFELPGVIPVVSRDGLRQHHYDGKTLQRARRGTQGDSFSSLAKVREMSLPDYKPQPGRRQIFVSEDEQWMVYSTASGGSADLYLVRLSDAPTWGFIATGKSIPPRPAAVAKNDSSEMKNAPETMKPSDVVENTIPPLPLATYTNKWRELVAQRKYAEALQLSDETAKQSEFSSLGQLLDDDRQVTRTVEQFWSLADAALKAMSEGDEFSFGTTKAKLKSYDGNLLTIAVGSKELERPLTELPRSAAVNFVADSLEDNDTEGRAAIAHFLMFDREGVSALALSRLEDNPKELETLIRHATQHELLIAEREFDRNRIAEGVALLEQIKKTFPESSAVEKVQALEAQLYSRTDWEQAGSRQWKFEASTHEYRADGNRAENSFLRSPKPLKNFELRFEWQTSERIGQGGVFFNYEGEGRIYNRAFKIQLANDAGVSPDQYSSGSLFGVSAPSENAVNPMGEWNTTVIRSVEGDVTVNINGKQVLDTLAISDVIPEEGFILFDGIPGGIAYRKIILIDLGK